MNKLLVDNNLKGYSVLDIFTKKNVNNFEKKILEKINIKITESTHFGKELENLKYFHKIPFSKKEKSKIFEPKDRFIKLNTQILRQIKKNKFINKILYEQWGHNKYKIMWVASLEKQEIKKNVCGFRICEPYKKGVGTHIDLHIGGKIMRELNSLISIWVPLRGFSKKYTLKFSPGSHLFDHPTNQFQIKKNIISKVFKKGYAKKFNFHRLNLKLGQGIIFNSNLLHGNSDNLGTLSRVSVEIRLYNSKKLKNWLPKNKKIKNLK